MSFDINPNKNLSNVQASSKSCPGGGGNTGYFKRGKKEEEETFNFKTEDYPNDSFVGEVEFPQEQEQSLLEFLKGLILEFLEMIKGFFKK